MAQNERFTQGPYEAVEVAEGLFHIHSPKGDRKNPVPIAVVDHHRDGHEDTRTVITPANAYLLAASWDIYQALTALVERYTSLVNCGDCGFWNPETDAEVIAARAALAKATNSTKGEQSEQNQR